MSERRLGILIGSSRFPDEPKLEALRFPENDVDGLNEILTSKNHGQFTQTYVLKNKLHHEILLKINEILRVVDKEDLVLIYYSGHGKLNPAGRLHLATSDTRINALEATSISVGTVKEYVDISASKKIILMLDCCFSGAAGLEFAKGGVDDQLQLFSGGRGTYIMTASTGIQVAQEKESDQYGVFTKHIIEGISSGEADLDGDGRITINELYRYVHNHVLEEGFQEPVKWDLNVRGELVIAGNIRALRERRRKQVRAVLGDLWTKGNLPEDILDTAKQICALNQQQITGELAVYENLLDQLIQGKLEIGEFISKWYKVRPEKPTSPAQKPDLKPNGSDKSRQPPVTSNAIKFGVVAGVIMLLMVGISLLYFWQLRNEVDTKLEQLDTQTSELEETIAKNYFPEKIENLTARMAELNRGVKNTREQAIRFGFRSKLKKLQDRLNQIQKRFEVKRKAMEPKLKGKIFVAAVPDNANVKILNIDQNFQQGMELEPGNYHIQVSLQGFVSQERWVELVAGEKKKIPVKLVKIPPPVGKIFVATVPQDAQVKILNIKPIFFQGMALKPGRYHIEVAAEGYVTQRKWIKLVEGQENKFLFKLLRVNITIKNSIGMEFVLIPAGKFVMGSPPNETYREFDEEQYEAIITGPFYIQNTEVTQGQWKRLMGDNPSYFKDCGGDCPVEQVSWDMARLFIQKLNQMEGTNKHRLPTEAEWEYACRAGTVTAYSFGDEADKLVDYAWYSANSGGQTHPVRKKKPNAWGLYDIHGNVYEWCRDWYGEYPSKLVLYPTGPAQGKTRVVRGGSWLNDAFVLRSANRITWPREKIDSFIGFRIARNL